ncbi:MAG: class I SAM-dependent methyltransferase [Anaerolineae bacterium]
MREETTPAVAGFGVWAATYDETIAKEVEQNSGMPYAEMLRRVVALAQVAPNARVLDIGSGTGALSLALAEHLTAGHLVGIDPTPQMLDRARENACASGLADRVEFRQASAEALPFEDASFDVVVSSIALHHTVVRRSLQEIARVLKPGGRLVVADMAPNVMWKGCLGLLIPPMTVLYCLVATRSLAIMRSELAALHQLFNKGEWEAMLHEAGFAAADVQVFHHPDHSWYPGMVILSASK